MAEKEKDEMIETTDQVKQGHADVGKFNIGVYIIITVVSVVYLILHFKP